MKRFINKYLLAIALSLGLISSSLIPVSVYAGPHNGMHCRWVKGHWVNGHYRPAHQVCTRGGRHHNCMMVKGHWRHGQWVAPHRVCR